MKIKYGQKIEVTGKLFRKQIMKQGPKEHYRSTWKVWEKFLFKTPKKVLFLGFRSLKNGTKYWDSECGWIFTPQEHFRAALVSPNEKENSFFVPMDCINPLKD